MQGLNAQDHFFLAYGRMAFQLEQQADTLAQMQGQLKETQDALAKVPAPATPQPQ